MPTKAAQTTAAVITRTRTSTTASTTTTTAPPPDATSKSDNKKREDSKKNSSPSSSKSDKYKIIYNKKAESEFFVDNSALAGFTGERILYMAIRELIENSLDSCESFSILPSIRITLKIYDPDNDLWILSCEDNGTGITSEKLPVAVCSFLTSAKYMEKQQRGLFGVGLKMVAAFSTKDTDFPIKVWNKSIEDIDEYYFELRTDIGTNKPIVLVKKSLKEQDALIKGSSGFRIQVVLRAKLVPITKNKIYEYVSETSIVNPYASLTFETDDGIFEFNRRTSIMPHPAQEILPHPSDMDLKTLKKAISKFQSQKMTLPKILSSSFQKLSYDKAKDIVASTGLSIKTFTSDFSEHDLIKIVNICKKTKFQNPNTDHLSPIGKDVLTIGMMSEYTIVSSKFADVSPIEKTLISSSSSQNGASQEMGSNDETVVDESSNEISHDDNIIEGTINESSSMMVSPDSELLNDSGSETGKPFSGKNSPSKSNFSVKVLKPVLTAYTSRTCVINNRPTIVETGLAYGGDIPSFKMYRFANKIPLLYDEGSDVAREVISEVEINKMGITKKQAKEQFSTNKDSKKDRVIEVLPLHIFFHICSTKIPYKTAGKESIASEGELKYYMKSCLSELYRKLSTQIRKELKLKEAENKLRLYKHYLPFIVESINESLGIKSPKLNESFSRLIENHLSKRPLGEEQDEPSQVTDSYSSSSSSSSSPPLSPASSVDHIMSKSVSNSPSLNRSTSSSSKIDTTTKAVANTVSANSNAKGPFTSNLPSASPAPGHALQNQSGLYRSSSSANSQGSRIKPKLPQEENSIKEIKSSEKNKKNPVDLRSNGPKKSVSALKPNAKKKSPPDDLDKSIAIDKIQSKRTKLDAKKDTKTSKLTGISKPDFKNQGPKTDRHGKDSNKHMGENFHPNRFIKNIDTKIKSSIRGKTENSITTKNSIRPTIQTKEKTIQNQKLQKASSVKVKNNPGKKEENLSQSKQLQSTLDSYGKRVNKGKKLG